MGGEKILDLVARYRVAEGAGTTDQASRTATAKGAVLLFDRRPLCPHKIPRQLLAGGTSQDPADEKGKVLRPDSGNRVFQGSLQQFGITERGQGLQVNKTFFRILSSLQASQDPVVER